MFELNNIGAIQIGIASPEQLSYININFEQETTEEHNDIVPESEFGDSEDILFEDFDDFE